MSDFRDCPRGPVSSAAARRLECEPGDLLHLRRCHDCGEVNCVCQDAEPEEDYSAVALAYHNRWFRANLDRAVERQLRRS